MNFNEYLSSLSGRSQRTIIQYQSDLKVFANWLDSYTKNDMDSLSPDDYQDYFKYLKSKNYSDATIRRLVTVLNGLLIYHGLNPVGIIHEVTDTSPLRPLTSGDFISSKQTDQLMKSLKNSNGSISRDYIIDRNRAIIRFMREYGFTPSEISRIDMKDLNLAQMTLQLPSETGIRNFNLSTPLANDIRLYLQSISELTRPKYHSDHPLFIAFQNTSMSFKYDYEIGKPKRLSIRAIQKMLQDEIKLAGLKDITATHLRNSCILGALNSSDSIEEVVSYFGLKNAFSLRRYVDYLNK